MLSKWSVWWIVSASPVSRQRAHRTGPGAPFGPLRTQIEPRLAQAVAEEGIAEELDRHAFAVGKQQHVVLPRHLAEQVSSPERAMAIRSSDCWRCSLSRVSGTI